MYLIHVEISVVEIIEIFVPVEQHKFMSSSFSVSPASVGGLISQFENKNGTTCVRTEHFRSK